MDWTKYLPDGEPQTNGVQDTDACVTFSALHCIETQLNRYLATSQLSSDFLQFLNEKGYIQNGKIRFSALFNAILDGTTVSGNSMVAVDNSIIAVGLIPETMLPLPPGEDFVQYMNKANITQEMKITAALFLDFVNIRPKFLYTPVTSQTLATAPVQLCIAICAGYTTEPVVGACTQLPQHCVMQYGIDGGQQIFDTILPYQKTLAADYGNFGVMQYIVTPAVPPTLFSKFLVYLEQL